VGRGFIVTASIGANTIGKYRLIAELGHGGMADVYLVVAQGLGGFNKLLVLKQLRPALVDDAEFLTMFLDEARLAARLNHPNVVHAYEVGQDGYRYFIAMEYLDGQPLHRIIRRAERVGGIPLSLSVQIIAHALAGAHYAHELKDYDGTPLSVVHRDLTPHNIFVTYSGEVKIVDFGIAKTLDAKAVTGSGVLKGKIAYMSPEQVRSEDVDRRADIFSAGVVLWEAAAGGRLWERADGIAIVQRLLAGDIPSIDEAAPNAPERVRRIVQRAVAPVAQDRFATARDLQTSLEAWLSEIGDRYSPTDIGDFVSALFEDERQRIAGVIEDRLRNVQALPAAGTASESIPRLLLDSPRGSLPDMSSPGAVLERPSSQEPTTPDTLSAPTGASFVGNVTSHSTAPPAARPHRTAPVVIAASLGVIAAVGAFGILRSRAPSPATDAPAASAPVSVPSASDSPAASASAPVPSTILLRLKAQPPIARFFLDGAPLLSNPHEARVPADSVRHSVRAEAPGFASASVEVFFDRDVELDLVLQAPPGFASGTAAASSHAPASATAPTAPASAATTAATATATVTAPPTVTSPAPDKAPPTQRDRRPIDTESPWK